VRLGAAALIGLLTVLVAAATAAADTDPQLGRTFVAARAGGTVRVKPAGSARFVALKRPRTIRVGSTVDATRGRVRLSGARSRSGGTYSGVFRGGAFRATQARRAKAVIELRLVGGDAGACAAAAALAGGSASATIRRRLWGQAKGRFRTRGRYAAGTIRGTTWLTEDECESTRVASERGTVEVKSPGITYDVEEGSVYDTRYTYGDLPVRGYRGFFSTSVVYDLPRTRRRRGEDGPDGSVVFLLGLNLSKKSRPTGADVCIQRVGGVEERCTTYAFTTNEFDDNCTKASVSECLYSAYDGCDPESGPGDYTVRWRVEGADLPYTLIAHAPTPDPYWLDVYQQPGSWCLRHEQVSAIP
jgi:hypothetical protein